jgi:hypothetical protein
LKSAARDLVSQATDIVTKVQGVMAGTAFGDFQNQANAVLGPLIAAFQQGPTAYAQALAAAAPTIGALEAQMPDDMRAAFQAFVDSMTSNTQATVDNTVATRQLEATTLAQDFASSAWSMFRSAIFTGTGRLLPQYAATVPSAAVGGYVQNSGMLYGHRGETIVPAKITSPYSVGPTTNTTHVHVTNPTEVADPVHLGNAIAFRLSHDPNAR